MVALAPAGADGFQARDDFGGALGIFGQRESFAARELQDFVVAQRLGYGKGRVAVLARSEVRRIWKTVAEGDDVIAIDCIAN